MVYSLVGTEILTWREEATTWVAAWTQRHLVAQGATEIEAVDALMHLVGVEYVQAAARGEDITLIRPLGSTLERWRQDHLLEHSDGDKK